MCGRVAVKRKLLSLSGLHIVIDVVRRLFQSLHLGCSAVRELNTAHVHVRACQIPIGCDQVVSRLRHHHETHRHIAEKIKE